VRVALNLLPLALVCGSLVVYLLLVRRRGDARWAKTAATGLGQIAGVLGLLYGSAVAIGLVVLSTTHSDRATAVASGLTQVAFVGALVMRRIRARHRSV
jgi:hypothetical protein